jgi:hypothetical protein
LLSGRPVVFEQPDALAAQQQPKAATQSSPEQPAKPWLPLTFTLFGLFASLGANVFLGWIAWDSRQRCRAVRNADSTVASS